MLKFFALLGVFAFVSYFTVGFSLAGALLFASGFWTAGLFKKGR